MKPRNPRSMPVEAIRFTMSLGYRVYMRGTDNSYFIYEDPKGGIAYAQFDWMSGYSTSTVHHPNLVSGTGYQITTEADRLTEQALADAIRITVPSWHLRDKAPRKYRNMAEFMSQDRFNAEYREVTASDLEAMA